LPLQALSGNLHFVSLVDPIAALGEPWLAAQDYGGPQDQLIPRFDLLRNAVASVDLEAGPAYGPPGPGPKPPPCDESENSVWEWLWSNTAFSEDELLTKSTQSR
jgi:hypothetical protein